MKRNNNPFSTTEELSERLYDAHRAGEKALAIPDPAREHLVLAQEYLRGLEDRLIDLHIARDIEEVDVQDARFDISRALIHETESLINEAHAEIEHEQNQNFYSRLGLNNPESDRGSPQNTFVISIYCEHRTQADSAAGQTSSTHAEIDRETVDSDELQRLGQDHGLDSPSASDPRQSPVLWFSSSSPQEDRAYFEQGVQKYYSLHIHEVNGRRPEPADYQQVSDLIGARFDHPLKLPEPTQEMEGPDL